MTFHPLRSFAVLIIAAALAGGACTAGPGGSAAPPATLAPSVATENGECPTSQPAPLPAGETRTVTIATALGSMILKIEADLSPIAAGNFVALAGCGYYDGVVFHRVVPGFVIQGGDPTGTGTGGPGYTIKDETVRVQYGRGVVAMARTLEPDSVGSQFFIVLDDAVASALSSAQYGYQIVGEVTSGMEAVDAIAAMPNSGEPNNAALDPVPMTSVTVATP